MRAEVLKACPVVLRRSRSAPNDVEILAFKHPLAGFQLVKGTVEPGETAREAAVRELGEEAGIAGGGVLGDLGIWQSGFEGQIWSFHRCRVGHELAETWVHHANDDGGHDFVFFWRRLHEEPGAQWHPLFRSALGFLRAGWASGSACWR